MYRVIESSKGYAIFYINDNGHKEHISDALTLKQANKWCQRLNDAFKRGIVEGCY